MVSVMIERERLGLWSTGEVSVDQVNNLIRSLAERLQEAERSLEHASNHNAMFVLLHERIEEAIGGPLCAGNHEWDCLCGLWARLGVADAIATSGGGTRRGPVDGRGGGVVAAPEDSDVDGPRGRSHTPDEAVKGESPAPTPSIATTPEKRACEVCGNTGRVGRTRAFPCPICGDPPDPLTGNALVEAVLDGREFQVFEVVVDWVQRRDHISASLACDLVGVVRSLAERLQRAETQLGTLESPWPLHDVLIGLADAVDHLFSDHDCDMHGHEAIKVCAAKAYEIASRLSSQTLADHGPQDFAQDAAEPSLDLMGVPKSIRQVRVGLGVSLRDAAQYMRIPVIELSKLERGKAACSADLAIRLLQAAATIHSQQNPVAPILFDEQDADEGGL